MDDLLLKFTFRLARPASPGQQKPETLDAGQGYFIYERPKLWPDTVYIIDPAENRTSLSRGSVPLPDGPGGRVFFFGIMISFDPWCPRSIGRFREAALRKGFLLFSTDGRDQMGGNSFPGAGWSNGERVKYIGNFSLCMPRNFSSLTLHAGSCSNGDYQSSEEGRSGGRIDSRDTHTHL